VNALDANRLAALATRLQLTPRQLLVVGAGLADASMPLDASRLDVEIARVRAAAEKAAEAADLALLGYGAFALDDIERGLALAWSPTQARGL
jgi:hypothetical protein